MAKAIRRNDQGEVIEGAVVKREEASPPVQYEERSILAIIDRAARDPSTDIEKMERLLQMHERISTRQAEAAFNAAMAECQSEILPVIKDAKNDQTNSMYARLETVIAAIAPVYTRHGFALSYGTDACPIADHIRVTCLVSHRSGFARSYHADVPFDLAGAKGNVNKTKTHAYGSTIAYGRRYLVLMIFNVPVKGEDKDGNQAGAVITEDQAKTLEALITEVGAHRPHFYKYMGIEALAGLRATDYDKAVKALQAKRRQAS